MSTDFLIEALEVTPHSGNRDRREFGPGLNVIIGDSGAGKSTLFEMAGFALGCDAQKTPVFEEDIREVSIDIVAGTRQLTLSRTVDAKPDVVRVFDRVIQEPVGTHRVTRHADGAAPIGTKLLEWLGMPTDIPIPGSDPPAVLTFADVWAFVHVTQPEIDRSIARHDAAVRANRRLRTFEMLFGMINPDLLDLNEKISEANRSLRDAKTRHSAVSAFLGNSPLADTRELRGHAVEARRRRAHYTTELGRLRSESGAHNDQVILLRGLLAIAHDDAADVDEEIRKLTRVQQDRSARIGRLDREITRLERLQHANGTLADIEFAICPRCMQSIAERTAGKRECHLCLQPEPDPEPHAASQPRRSRHAEQIGGDPLPLVIPERSTGQERQLAAQREETERLLQLGKRELCLLWERHEAITTDASDYRVEIERLSEEAVTPRVDELTTVTRLLTEAESAERSAEEALRLWDGLADVAAEVTSAEAVKHTYQEDKKTLEESLEASRDLLFNDLTRRFTHYLRQFRAPNAREGTIDPQKYLPYIDGKRFDRISIGGGNRTVFIVAYWLTLLAESLHDPNRMFPAFLVLDSPQKSLPSEGDSSRSIYAELQVLSDAAAPPDKPGRRVQIFVIDNRLPDSFEPTRKPTRISYSEPAIRTIPHPGPQEVRTLEGADPLEEA